jgi:hypothetical protein
MRHGAVSRTVALLAGVVVSIAGVVAVPGSAWARTLGSYAGNPLDNTARSCFSESQGGLTYAGGQSCPGIARWQVMLPTDAVGTYTVKVRGSRELAAPIFSCQVLSQTQDGVLSSQSTVQQLPSAGQMLTMSMSVAVPASGYMFLVCWGFGVGDFIAGITY